MRGALLGAGFSKWAANLPLASELFDFNVSARNPREARRLELVEDEWQRWCETETDGVAERFIAWALEQSEKRRRRVIWYISRRLSDPFVCRILGGTATYMIDDSRVRSLDGVARAHRFLARFLGEGASGIVTTNYDMLAEYALKTRYFNYGRRHEVLHGRGKNPYFPWQHSPVRLNGFLPVAKVHGSLSWDAEHKYTDGRRGLAGVAQIVPPYPEKTPPPELHEVWELATQILSRCTQLAVFGFAFNPYDQALLELLRDSGKDLKQVLLIDVAPQPAVAQQLWPNAEIVTSEPPDPVSSQLQTWFAEPVHQAPGPRTTNCSRTKLPP